MTIPSSTFVATDGGAYEHVMGRWSRRLVEPFLGFVGPVRGNAVLDVGCGTGHLAGAIAARTDDVAVHGIDLSPVYVDFARRQYTGSRVTFDVGNACAMAFDDARFDAVLSMLMLHFVPRGAEAIAEMRRVAKPGAVVAAAVWDVRGGFVANRIFFDTAAALDPEAGVRRARNFTRPLTRPGELGRAWRDAGFRDVVEASLAIRMEFASFEDYWSPYTSGEGPGAEYVKSLDETGRTRLHDALRAAYLDGEPDGPRSYAALAWAVKGIA